MCVVSTVTDRYMKQWPQPSRISPSIYRDIEELIRKAKLYDMEHGEPECPAPDKQEWLEKFSKNAERTNYLIGTPMYNSPLLYNSVFSEKQLPVTTIKIL